MTTTRACRRREVAVHVEERRAGYVPLEVPLTAPRGIVERPPQSIVDPLERELEFERVASDVEPLDEARGQPFPLARAPRALE